MCRACSLAWGMCISQGRSEPELHPARRDLILDARWEKHESGACSNRGMSNSVLSEMHARLSSAGIQTIIHFDT